MQKLSHILPPQFPKRLAPQFFIAIAATLVSSGWGLVSATQTPAVAQLSLAASEVPVTTKSGAAEIALAEHLTRVGAKMYGAYWCPHCHSQKQLFGKEAWSKVTYIECAPDGPKANPQACNQAKVEAYPTWLINNKKYMGATSLFRLARASNYKGPTSFRNTLSR